MYVISTQCKRRWQVMRLIPGELDILVSGAAGNFPALANDMSPNGFKSVVDIDLLGSFHVLRSAFPYLTKPGASVINISAPQAFVPMPMQSHVCAAKAGVDMLTRTLALEWGPYGIRINSISPGPIADTEGMRRLAPNEGIAKQYKKECSIAALWNCGRDRSGGDVSVVNCCTLCKRRCATRRRWLVGRRCQCHRARDVATTPELHVDPALRNFVPATTNRQYASSHRCARAYNQLFSAFGWYGGIVQVTSTTLRSRSRIRT